MGISHPSHLVMLTMLSHNQVFRRNKMLRRNKHQLINQSINRNNQSINKSMDLPQIFKTVKNVKNADEAGKARFQHLCMCEKLNQVDYLVAHIEPRVTVDWD